MNDLTEKSGERAATRQRLVTAFNTLLLDGNDTRPRVADVIAEAGVARSTFYDHFDGIEALYDESLSTLFGQIAAAILPPGDAHLLSSLLAHVWQNRPRGRELLTGDRSRRAETLLARLIEDRLSDSATRRQDSILSAGLVIAALGGWLCGRFSSEPGDLAQRLIQSTAAILAREGF